eukprot:CAMPEP_0171750388 /NCGR_PEP_ID=MMETSP0991-20121206/41359_1 /TAXON_ID=483369 /ORGANISM="non described non described, Strain CCMP2098" /LENGTH=48 /DNA_ID= /DNA_START= /DNA_END= /DNA_ORIENTATION=
MLLLLSVHRQVKEKDRALSGPETLKLQFPTVTVDNVVGDPKTETAAPT